jgi:hypothetical protein
VLCVYITEDAGEARKLIYGLLLTDVFVVALGWITAMHLRLAGAPNDYICRRSSSPPTRA